MAALGVFLGVIGPFGSFSGGGIEFGSVIGRPTVDWLHRLVDGVRLSLRAALRFDLPIWFAVGLGVAVGALPLAVILANSQPGSGRPITARSGPVPMYAQTLALSEPFAFGYYFVAVRGRRGAEARERTRDLGRQHPGLRRPRLRAAAGFLDRLPPRLGRDLLCLQMEDHYVRAHTSRGSDLILTPLKEAIADLGAAEGLQVHRSWWVARDAVAEPVTRGRNLVLRLTNGLEVPVSRTSVAKLRAAGWLEGA